MEKVGNGTIGGYLLSFIGRFFEETHTKEGYLWLYYGGTIYGGIGGDLEMCEIRSDYE